MRGTDQDGMRDARTRKDCSRTASKTEPTVCPMSVATLSLERKHPEPTLSRTFAQIMPRSSQYLLQSDAKFVRPPVRAGSLRSNPTFPLYTFWSMLRDVRYAVVLLGPIRRIPRDVISQQLVKLFLPLQVKDL